MRLIAMLLMSSFPGLAAATYCQPIVIQHSRVSNADQTNFVLTINDTDPKLAILANGGYVTNANGNDIVFSSDSAGRNLLTWDPLEVYNPVTGQIVTHVSVGTISHTADTTIYRCTGHAGSTFAGGATGAAWPSGYAGVYHFAGTGGLSAADATVSGNNGIVTGATAVAGKIGGAASITGAADNVTLSQPVGLPFTIEAWVNINAISTGDLIHIPGSYNDLVFFVDGSGNLRLYYGADCASSAPVAVSSGAWQHLAASFSSPGGTCNGYLNGIQVASGSMLGQSQGGVSPAVLGNLSSGLPLGGALDEVRLYSGVLSASRIATDFNNQSAPLSFYVPGSWTALQVTRNAASQIFVF